MRHINLFTKAFNAIKQSGNKNNSYKLTLEVNHVMDFNKWSSYVYPLTKKETLNF
jgi:hypothetical protein